MKLEERFWSKVAKDGDGCWQWTAHVNNKGYGQIHIGPRRGSHSYAHRVSWELAYGPIPSGLHVLHKCDNPRCVRPDHLFLGTQKDNMIDKARKGRHPRNKGRYLPEGEEWNKRHLASLPRGDDHWTRRRKLSHE